MIGFNLIDGLVIWEEVLSLNFYYDQSEFLESLEVALVLAVHEVFKA